MTLRALILILSLSLPSNAQAQTIDWELRYPLRLMEPVKKNLAPKYFGKQRGEKFRWDWSYLERLYVDKKCFISADPILCAEKSLGPTRISSMRETLADGMPKNSNSVLAEAYLRLGIRYSFRSRFHYPRLIRTHNTNPEECATFENRYEDKKLQALALDYSRWRLPLVSEICERHKVWLTLKGLSEKEKKATCQWFIDGPDDMSEKPIFEGKCETRARGGINRGNKKPSRIRVKILTSNKAVGEKVIRLNKPPVVSEKIIVGLGDSFASGEGNPDIPANMSGGLDNYDVPLRKEAEKPYKNTYPNAAYWLDRNCHRALLGSQARAVIQLAAENPKIEISFLGLSCSGAEVLEGILGPYAGTQETSLASRILPPWQGTLSQVNQAMYGLCYDKIRVWNRYVQPSVDHFIVKKSADIVSLSMDPKVQKQYLLKRRSGTTTEKNSASAYKNLDDYILRCSKENFRKVDAVLLSVGGNDIGFAKVVFNAIQDNWLQRQILAYEGRLITPSQSYFEIKNNLQDLYDLLNVFLVNRFHLKDSKKIIITTYPNILNDEKGQLCGKNNGTGSRGLDWLPPFGNWRNNTPPFRRSRVTLSESKALLKHVLLPLNEIIKKQKWTVANSHYEKFSKHGWCAKKTGEKDYIKKKDILEFSAFTDTQRWARHINDGVLVQNQRAHQETLNEMTRAVRAIKPPYLRTYGMFHPNYLGAAALADSYLKELRSVLDLRKPNSETSTN